MCFGPVASFTASGFLAATGIAVIRNVRNKKEQLFAVFPMLFALQQFVEGLLWLQVRSGKTGDAWTQALTFLFLLFAYGLWPVMCPLSVYNIEYNPKRRKILAVLILIGILTSVYLMLYVIINPFKAFPLGCSIRYETLVPLAGRFTVLYLFATILPYFVSSHRSILFFGLPNLVFCVIAYAAYTLAFISVWCFFAALISANLYFFLRKLHHEPLIPPVPKLKL